MSHDILREQLAYYRARAKEYDESLQGTGKSAHTRGPDEEFELMQAASALHALPVRRNVLELAGGTGIWTQELLTITADLTVLDGSPEMLAINRAKIADPRVRYECVDLFAWEPKQEYDLVFFAFWLSHVPPDLLAAFFSRVGRAVSPGGRVFIVDEPAGGRQLSGPSREGMYQERRIQNGRQFSIVKVYYDPAAIQEHLQRNGFGLSELVVGKCFFHLISLRK